jgi:glucose-1-phosphate cytidylyltransferase
LKAVILAGGLGTRISEETSVRPKPLIEVGGRPLLWHIMKGYAAHGIRDFVICLGYKGYMIKEYFANFYQHSSDVTFDLAANTVRFHRTDSEPWTVTLVDTGEATETGGRLKRIQPYLLDESFCFTYGDGVSDINVTALVAFHRKLGKRATVTAVRPPARFGSLVFENDLVTRFSEKPTGDNMWISGGFFVLEPSIFQYIESDRTAWERGPLEALAADRQLNAYRHFGFWHPVDTLRDKLHLEALWSSGAAPWKTWA